MKLTSINHIELIVSFISIFSGIILIILGYIYNKKYKSDEIKAGIVFTAGTGIYVSSNFILYYINCFIQKNSGIFSMSLNDLSIAIVILSIYYAVQKVVIEKRNNIELILITVYIISYIVIYQIVYFKFMTYNNLIESKKIENMLFFLEVGIRVIVVYIIAKAVINLKKIEDIILKKRLKILLTVLLLVMAISFFETGVSILLIYLGINIYGILLLIKKLQNDNTKNDEQSNMKNIAEIMELDEIAEKYNLTTTEKEIVSLVYKGFTNAEIAEMREITLSTVKRHVYNVFKKLDVSNRVEMIHMIKND